MAIGIESMRCEIRRIVTGHDASGRAVVRSEDRLVPKPVSSGKTPELTLVWTTSTVPADNNDEVDGATREAATTLLGGSVLRIVDMPAGTRSPLHRSFSIDYGLVLEGEVDLELDDGVAAHLKAGDIVIQRGTIHAWANNSANWSRMAFVLIEAAPVKAGGRVLEEIHG